MEKFIAELSSYIERLENEEYFHPHDHHGIADDVCLDIAEDLKAIIKKYPDLTNQ